MNAPVATGRLRRRVAELVGACSIELSPRDDLAGPGLAQIFRPGTTVFVNYSARVTYHDVTAACMRLHRAGFTPVPHVVARRLGNFTQADEFLRRAAGEACVSHVLLLGGDAEPPVGPFSSALDLLATGVVERHGITHVSFAGYPEGHRRVGADVLALSLRAKGELARQRGLTVSVVTQFGFEPEPVLRWLALQRIAGLGCPVCIGLAGPATVATLAKYAVRCGIGASLHALTHGHTAIARILTEASPDALIEALVAAEDPAAPISALHIFTFGGLRRTAAWQHATLARHA